MPRLTGRSPYLATKGAVAVALLVIIAFFLELLGVIDLVPQLGKSSQPAQEETQLLGGNDVQG